MAVSIRCECGKRLKVADTLLGKKVKCPDCQSIVLVTEGESEARKAAPAGAKAKTDDTDGRWKVLFLVFPLLLLVAGGAIFLFFPDLLGLRNDVPPPPAIDDRVLADPPKENTPADSITKQPTTLDKKDPVVPDKTLSDPNPQEEEIENTIGMQMMRIGPGKFVRGSPAVEKDREACEEAIEIEITQPFYMGKFEVTQREWTAIMGDNPSKFRGEQLPVDSVSWDDAREFCSKLSAKEGRLYTLPTEAEWEFACRAGRTTVFHMGNALTTALANFNGNFVYASGPQGKFRQKTTEVGSFAANGWGLHDMHGNVAEWCEDYYEKDYYKLSLRDPQGPPIGEFRCVRGGSWSSAPAACRSASRFCERADVRSATIGFRVVLRPRARSAEAGT